VSPRVTDLRRSLRKRRIEVVLADDDGGFVESLRTIVDDQPSLAVVGVAVDGLEAIELVEELAPQAVVIDLHMPLLDGVSAVARIRQDHPGLCLIAITADEAPELHRAVEEAGADVVLMKEHLADALADQIAQRAVM
jgi:two-component system, NarL family, response regulator DesR